ncbi:ferric-chelate reductase Frp1 [Elasticomyces elasticus]|nr:ferric-chelate reductase Frp1 [Elasticomyces elasticus]
MDMGMGMGMGDTAMGPGVPGLFYLQNMYWAAVGAVVAAGTAANVYNYLLYRQRISAARQAGPTPAKPRLFHTRAIATTTAILREFSNASYSFSLPLVVRLRLPSPTLGRTFLVLANTIAALVLCFYKLNTGDRWSFEVIGYRTGFITICQLPLLFLLAGKRNIIGYMTGSSHERLNVLHRWTARTLLLTATIHMGYFFADWAPYGYIGTKIREDSITQRGVIAWAILLWICISSMTPVRGWNYEFFVLQHIVSFVAFIAMVYVHTPPEVHIWIWISVGLFAFDRVLRAAYNVYTNLAFFHPKHKPEDGVSTLWTCKADITPLTPNTTRITIRNPPVGWSPGQHVFLSCHSLTPLQAHPFTICSIPEDGKMEFLVQSHGGATKKLRMHAEKTHGLPTQVELRGGGTSVAIEGPYGFVRPLRQFDSVVLLAGSTGITFTLPLLRDLVQAWKTGYASCCTPMGSLLGTPAGAATTYIRFIWVVKSGAQLSWFATQLNQVAEDVAALKKQGKAVRVEVSVYITCDEIFTTEQESVFPALQPAHTAPWQLLSQHGRVQEVGRLYSGASISSADEKSTHLETNRDLDDKVREVDSSTASLTDATQSSLVQQSCGPNGTCCCTAPIDTDDPESASSIFAAVCTCNCRPSSRTQSSTDDATILHPQPATRQPLLHPSIPILSGRPVPRILIRRSLEQARGESAVVVCGPKGLIRDVRRAVVGLSDERAVCKGTGAQGVWLHCEGFGY